MGLIELTIVPSEKDVGSFSVRRVLPFAKRRMVGPFIFFDHMGPAHFNSGEGIDVRPHPHIGLATVTFLFQGELLHRDTLGSVQTILPGDVNWMTAGRGIAHSERTTQEKRPSPHEAHGLQCWVALPQSHEETAPEFHHHKGESLAQFVDNGISFKIICGEFRGNVSPVKLYSPLFYVEVIMPAGTSFVLPTDYYERALYLVAGQVRAGGQLVTPGTMPIFAPKYDITIEATTPSHLILLGGDPFPEERYIWWNFVSSSKDRLVQAQEDWRSGRFGTIPGDDKGFIPLP